MGMIYTLTITDTTTGKTTVHKADLCTIYNLLDKYSSFEFTIREITRATGYGEIIQLNRNLTAQILPT
jgi:hypothetical protein